MSRWRRALVGLASIALVVLPAAGGVARAEAPGDPASVGNARPAVTPAKDRALITLTALEPVVVAPGTTVTISGTVTAPTVGALTGATLQVVRGTATLDQRFEIDGWAKRTGPASGATVASQSLPTVEAGASRPFRVTFPASRVASQSPFAAIPLALQVTPRGAAEPAGVTRTFLSWQSRKEYVPLEVATILPLTLDPDLELFSRDADRRADAWSRTVGPDSRIRDIIDGSAGHEVTLAVDPSLFGPSVGTSPPPPLETPAPSATGTAPAPTTAAPTAPAPSIPTPRQTATATSSPTAPGSATPPSTSPPAPTPSATPAPDLGGASITRLADQLVAQLRGRSVWALPYADADVAAAVGLDPTNAVVRDLVSRSSIVARRLDQPVRADVVMPVDGLLPVGREAAVTQLLAGTTVGKPAGLVVNSAAVTGRAAYTPSARRITAQGTRLLAWDPALSALLPSGAESGVLNRQRFLADTLALLAERPGTARSVLLLAPRTYDPDPAALRGLLAAIDAAPWLSAVPAETLLVDAGSDTATRAQSPAGKVASAAPRATLTTDRLARMAQQRETLRRVATVLRDGPQFEAIYRELLDELASARWRWAPEDWARLETSVATDVRQATSAIRVVPRSFNFLAEQGTLTLTVENGLDFAVDDIRLVLAPTNPRMQVIEQPGPVSIGAGSKTSVKVSVRAVAAGQADIRAFLTTADGTPIGQPAILPIVANPLDSTIYGIGGVVVGLILLAGVVRTIVKGKSRIDEIEDPDAVTRAAEQEDDG